MRIISGKARGHKLFMVKSSGTRPTADRVKESLFNILEPDLAGYRVLDLFAGIGNIGLEALSRGAERVVFVEIKRDCIQLIKRNLVHTKLDNGNIMIINDDFRKAIKKLNEKFDLIFIDPPYASKFAGIALMMIKEHNLLDSNGLVIVEHDKNLEELSWSPYREKKYGQTFLSFFKLDSMEEMNNANSDIPREF